MIITLNDRASALGDPDESASAETDVPGRASGALERLAEFVVLADQLLNNPAVVEGLSSTLSYRQKDESGSGLWSLVGPNEHLIRSLLLDVRNVVQASSDLELSRVINDLDELVTDAEAHEALAAARQRYESFRETGIATQNGKPLRPAKVVEFWMYALYHHRDLSKLRQIRAMEPMLRLVHQMEFMEYLRNVCSEVLFLRHVIDAARTRGFLSALEIPTPHASIAPREAAHLAPPVLGHGGLLLLLHRSGGSIEFTPEALEVELAEYGGSAGAAVYVAASGVGGRAKTVRLTLGRRDETSRATT